jgi:hypothetical protein
MDLMQEAHRHFRVVLSRGAFAMTVSPYLSGLEAAFQRARNMDAPLDQRLAVIATAIRALNASVAEAVDRMVTRLQSRPRHRRGDAIVCVAG